VALRAPVVRQRAASEALNDVRRELINVYRLGLPQMGLAKESLQLLPNFEYLRLTSLETVRPDAPSVSR
jgi:hypothetical protein